MNSDRPCKIDRPRIITDSTNAFVLTTKGDV